jgi:thioredoxin reductase (NADPH)
MGNSAEKIYDIGIIGGGTAGMTAAIYGQRAGKQTVIIEGSTFGGQITSSPNVENYPGIASVSGSEFSMNLLDQATKLGAETVMEQVTGIVDGENGVKVIHTTGKEYRCRSVILATGVTHRHLGVPNEERLTGAGVSYCATCDGMFFRGRDVAVVGGGSTALQDAEFLSDYCRKVYLIHRRDEFRGEENIVKRLEEKENVEFILSTTVRDIIGDQTVERLILNNKKTGKEYKLEVSGIFIAVGHITQNEIFADIVRLDENGFVLAAEDCVTSHPGIFAAGDCRTKEVRQLTTAAADGAVAALAACKYIAG